MLLRLRHSILDYIGDALKAPIAPKPCPAREISSYRCANAVGTVTPGARRPSNLAMEDFLAERDLLARCSWGYRHTGIGVNALGLPFKLRFRN
jgi:hypothetical protein